MFRRLLLAALIAGACAGLVASALQMIKVWPLILEAETYENAAPAAHAHAPGTPATHDHAAAAPGQAEAWEPENGVERISYTVLFNLLAGIGFALLLNGALGVRQALGGNSRIDPRTGMLWGLAGFACFAFAPALGLPPEPPGMVAADLALRQTWWIATALATALGLGLCAFAPARVMKGMGVLILLAPHLVGAPHPAEHGGAVPPALAANFAMASLLTAAVFWIVLGGVSGWLQRRLAA
jgi:cobalt transporter subunit CbtA